MTDLSKDGAGAVLSWDDNESTDSSTLPAVQQVQPVNELPPEAAQLANYLNMANAFLQNPTVGILAKYAGHPQALINGMPNMVLAMQLKQELDAVKTASQPERIRIRCHECGQLNSITPGVN